ncbi:Voltage-dependent T-type calcium channel subunit alpha-1G [Eufriesea mexicana]|nr:Voltage-dependent T-type calcium channel subunit alpha-1G [Eufriesea mexicana]
MSLHYPQGYRYRPATKAAGTGNGEQGSDSDVAELSDLEDDEDEDGGDIDGDELPYPGFVPVALRYLDQNTRPRNWCLALITNPYPFGS